jgi:DNA relaxase NicK
MSEVNPEWVQSQIEWAAAAAAGVPRSAQKRSGVDAAGDASQYVTREADCHEEGGIGVHWLRGTVKVEERKQANLLMLQWFGARQELLYGREFYREVAVYGSGGASMCGDGIQNASKTLLLEVPGGCMEKLTADKQLELVHDLARLGFSCARVDAEFDDTQKIITPAEVYAVAKAGGVVGFKRREFREVGETGSDVSGSTCYLGRRGGRGSGKFLRVYDKEQESEGAIDAVRWECEFSGKHSREVFTRLAACKTAFEFVRTVGASLGGCVDFVERTSAHVDRCVRLPWYQRIVDVIGRARVRIARKAPTVERMARWCHSVSTVFALVREAYRQDGVEEEEIDREVLSWLDEGRERWKPRHFDALMEYLRPGDLGLT